MQENILQTRCMDLGCTVLQTVIGMRELGMREEDKALGCTHLGMGKHSQVTGRMGFLMFQALRTQLLLYLLLQFIIPRF